MFKKVVKRYLVVLLAVVVFLTMNIRVQGAEIDLQVKSIEEGMNRKGSINPGTNIGQAIAKQKITVYLDKSFSKVNGYIFANEGFTIIDQKDDRFSNDYIYVDYSGPNGYKQGYVPINEGELPFRYEAYSCAATVQVATTLWYGPNANQYQPFGMVYEKDSVAILRHRNGEYWAYIEYNAPGALRRRGYVPYQYLVPCISNPELRPILNPYRRQVLGKRYDVYAGPTKVYPIIGTIFATDEVGIIDDTSNIWNVTYKVNGDLDKSGYIFIN